MHNVKKLALASAIASIFAVTGCSNSGSSGGDSASGETVSGNASAPSGTVAKLNQPSVIEIALSFVVPEVAAAITGLEPIKGADVELIRVDDDGNQVGDVLATTSTSITGDYTLTLPTGVSLAGNLIVRITGANHQLRAQVVEKNVDISPVSEFVLRKFIESGADLDQLVVTDVVKLNGKVEEFDLTAGANLEQMFDVLEQEVGAFVETEVASVSANGADVSNIVGDYNNAAFAFSLHDNDDRSNGTFAHDMWLSDFTFADGGTGTVNITFLSEDSAWANLSGAAIENSSVYYSAELDDGGSQETFDGSLNTRGILAVQGEFEEDIDGNEPYGWRFPAMTYAFQQVADTGLFFGLTHEAGVRYGTIDSDNDGTYDAIDPNDKHGDEVFRTLEVFARKPANLSDTAMTGEYGRVYFGSRLSSGRIELLSANNTVTFSSGFNGTVSAGIEREIIVDSSGAASYGDQSTPSESFTLTVMADGTITEGPDGGAIGFVSEDAGYVDFSESAGDNTAGFAEFDKTMLVKLGDSAPSVSGKKYRLMMVSSHLEGGASSSIAMFASQFNTFLTMDSNSAGKVSGNFSEIRKEQGLGDNIEATVHQESDLAFNIEIGSSGGTTITIPDTDEGATKFEGFFNADASFGVFTTGYLEKDAVDYNELGLAVLVDVTPK
ncbi:hypothetical protein DOQ08_02046 [Marinobacter litoralis]|uniref:Uncharacterized protein n=1 Tax=Marinobacter litoralis TaxID=187981 RepID=A0A3M2RBD2_9GAMM|nr:hypothetical protein [Marinobacter litoralis]RMJ02583.1 hypothetical protein DOQ08_02046 [Marinobacter litoralis]